MALALAPRTFVVNHCKIFTGSHHQRTRNGVMEGFRIMLAQRYVILSIEVLGMAFWHDSG
eukprot:7583232-Pyramimonas_sp.AAC.1